MYLFSIFQHITIIQEALNLVGDMIFYRAAHCASRTGDVNPLVKVTSSPVQL